jgi:hypothetical protein
MPHVGIVGYDFGDYDSDSGGWAGFLTRFDGWQSFFLVISPVKILAIKFLQEILRLHASGLKAQGLGT